MIQLVLHEYTLDEAVRRRALLPCQGALNWTQRLKQIGSRRDRPVSALPGPFAGCAGPLFFPTGVIQLERLIVQ
jgi:hypothetical protein